MVVGQTVQNETAEKNGGAGVRPPGRNDFGEFCVREPQHDVSLPQLGCSFIRTPFVRVLVPLHHEFLDGIQCLLEPHVGGVSRYERRQGFVNTGGAAMFESCERQIAEKHRNLNLRRTGRHDRLELLFRESQHHSASPSRNLSGIRVVIIHRST